MSPASVTLPMVPATPYTLGLTGETDYANAIKVDAAAAEVIAGTVRVFRALDCARTRCSDFNGKPQHRSNR
jgi:hypothetical protein